MLLIRGKGNHDALSNSREIQKPVETCLLNLEMKICSEKSGFQHAAGVVVEPLLYDDGLSTYLLSGHRLTVCKDVLVSYGKNERLAPDFKRSGIVRH